MHDPQDARQQWYRGQGWWPGVRLIERYSATVKDCPDGLAVLDDRGQRLTHAELWAQAGELAKRFGDYGLSASDRVLIFMENRVEWQLALLAILRLGAVPANIPVRTDADTLAYVLDLCGIRAVIASDRSNPSHDVPIGPAKVVQEAVQGGAGPLVLVRVLDGGEFEVDEPLSSSCLAVDHADPPAGITPDVDHIMFTSSTTGRPKAVMHSADTLAALNITFIERFELEADKAIFMASPLGHSVGAIHGARLCLYGGFALVLQDRWDPAAALASIEIHQCQFTAAATPFLKDLLDMPWTAEEPKLGPVRSFLCGGAQVPASLMKQAASEFPRTFVTVLWGMTEGGLTTCVADSSEEQLLHTAGRGLPGLELAVLDQAGGSLPAGEEGELAMRGPGVFQGYLGQPDLYQSMLTEDGYFRTGDLARLDEAGYVRITGRLKDLIIRGGVNISPVPIEDMLAAHPVVQSVAVIGYPDQRLGERLCAVLELGAEHKRRDPPTVSELRMYLTERGLPKYLCPELVRTVDDMPRTPAGKIRKVDLRAAVLDSNEA